MSSDAKDNEGVLKPRPAELHELHDPNITKPAMHGQPSATDNSGPIGPISTQADHGEMTGVTEDSKTKDAPSSDPNAGATSTSTTNTEAEPEENVMFGGKARKPFAFWAIMASLSLTGLLSAIEGTIITSALPTIINALGGGNLYIWVPNAYFLASIATLPLFAQASDIFGRRWLLLGAVALFILGSGLCGGSNTMGMLIAARTVQGLGGGGINLLIETVVTDLVPLRERGTYIALTMVFATLGAAIGPFIGGLIAERTTWRWCFYINLPIGGAAFIALFVFLRVNHERDPSWRRRLARIDFTGNAIFVAAIVAMLLALTWGGAVYEWNTYHVIVPLVLGFVGLGLFTTYEWVYSKEPSFPRAVLANRTSAAAFTLTLLHSISTYWAFYFMPIYFQSVKAEPPFMSGVYTLPIFAGILPFAMGGGLLLSKTGRYKPIHLAGFAVITVSFGLLSLLDANSSTAAWVCFQLLLAAGSGLLAGILLPAMQAPLEEKLMAATTGVWAFARGFGAVWGVTIPSAVLNNEARVHAEQLVQDPELRGFLTGGRAYEFATEAFLNSIEDPEARATVVLVFSRSLRTVWYVAVAFAGLAFLVTFIEKEVELKDKHETKFGIQEKSEKDASEPAQSA
jgi:hypothetical protein